MEKIHIMLHLYRACRSSWLVLLFLLSIHGSYGQKLAADDLRRDFSFFRDTLFKVHPALYRYSSKAQVDRVFDSCLSSIRDSMDPQTFYAMSCYAIAAIGDGHANCRPSRSLLDAYKNEWKVFPAMVMFIHERMYVYSCDQDTGLAKSEIISIDGHPSTELVQRLFAYVGTDGHIQSRKDWEMPELFNFFYYTVYGPAERFEVRYKTNSGVIQNTTLRADLVKNIVAGKPFPRPTKYLDLRYTEDNIAILTARSFYDAFLEKTGEHFQGFLDSAFADLRKKGIQKLIIDIRRNQGGNDHNGELFYSYLTKEPFSYYASMEMVGRRITVSECSNLDLQQPAANAYLGKVYFLIDGRTFSAAAEFAAVARSYKRGILIGEETGGGYYGNTSGGDAMVTLPASQVSCRIPLVKYTLAVKEAADKDRGVIPDHVFYPTIADLVEQRDEQLAYALRVVRTE